jgi:SAM-dependent methyltransferase
LRRRIGEAPRIVRNASRKPPGLAPRYGAQFKDPAIVRAYATRPPYPEALLARLVAHSGAARPAVLDLGCGTGELARRLAPHVARISAVDQSEEMIATARGLPGADAPNLAWIAAPVEEAELEGPYDVALAAESFHWFDWAKICPRIVELVPTARLVLIDGRSERGSPWLEELFALVPRYSTNRDFQPYDLVSELVERECFELEVREDIEAPPFRQTVADYVACLHSRNGFSLDRMEAAAAAEFDAAVRDLVSPFAVEGYLELDVVTRLAVGWARA